MTIFKGLEEYISEWLKNDSDVEGNSYFTKILAENRNFRSNEIPAISTYTFSILDNKNGKSDIAGKVEIFVQNKDPKTNNDDCKKIVSQVYKSLKKEFVKGVAKPADITIVKINSERGEAMPAELFKGMFAYGYVDFKITIMN